MANDSYTRDVAQRGLAAVRDRRQASQYGINNNQAALDYLMQSGYSARTPNGMYDQWRQSRGFNPQQYQITYGRGDGKYAGYETVADMWRANSGLAETLRAQDREQSQALSDLAAKYLQQATDAYGKQQTRMNADVNRKVNSADDGGYSDLFQSGHAAMVDKELTSPEMAKQKSNLNDWLAKTTNPYQDALDMAQQVQTTPLRDYAQIAGAELGIDPLLIAGKYPEISVVKDFKDQQDIAALQNYGLAGQREVDQFMAEKDKQATQAAALEQQAQDQMVNDYVYSVLGADATQAAQALDMTPDQLANELQNPVYQDAADEIQQIIDDSGGDPATMTNMLQQSNAAAVLYQDPVVGNLLRYQFPDYIDLLDG